MKVTVYTLDSVSLWLKPYFIFFFFYLFLGARIFESSNARVVVGRRKGNFEASN